MIIDEAHEPEIEEENYFVSMTDMMVGLVFIFIILLMYYALQFNQVTDKLSGADRDRAEILQKLKQTLKEKGVEVEIDTQNGVLHLPDAILFESGRAELKAGGEAAVGKLAEALGEILPCYADGGNTTSVTKCPDAPHKIESLYIEGHTDTDRLSGSGMMRDNWDLSVVRATNTYRTLTGLNPGLSALCARRGDKCAPILSVSGYGPQRPISEGATIEAKARNRRIDLRLIMVTPDAPEVDSISNAVNAKR